MTQLEKFNETVNILVKAYLNGTLEHGNCSACAVGNIIAARTGTKTVLSCDMKNGEMYKWENGIQTMWQRVFVTPHHTMNQKFDVGQFYGEAKIQIEASGYSLYDLAKIELAFEHTTSNKGFEDRMFKGLMNVVDVLAEIHGVSLETKETACKLFIK